MIFILIALLIGAGYIALQYYKNRRARANAMLDMIWKTVDLFDQTLTGFYKSGSGTYQETSRALGEYVDTVRDLNERVTGLFPADDQSNNLNHMERTYLRFNEQMESVQAIRDSEIMDGQNYGRVRESYVEEIGALSRQEALQILENSRQAFADTDDYRMCLELDPAQLLKCVWFFAMEKPFSAADLKQASNLFTRVYHGGHMDVLIAEVYSKKQIGGEDVILDFFRGQQAIEHNKKTYGSKLALVASSLMWMQAYKAESAVLQGMLTSGMEMEYNLQKRLYALSNGGGNAPGPITPSSDGKTLHFDVSALSWRDEDYKGLFENLAFQDRQLDYSLAVRDEDKELLILQGISLPEEKLIQDRINACFREEYGDSAAAALIACAALSGNSREEMTGILATAKECPHLGILMHTARIGKKLTIKFYTLFMPGNEPAAVQREKVLSLSKKLGHSAAMWESSMKDTMLMALQQLLNQTPLRSNTAVGMETEQYF